MHLAVSAGSPEIVTLLLDKDANPNVKNARQETPLHL
ncbi:ankyrin repeat domain-containing protein, partial [Candidatus Babeliales bacterium]|nr:ankyrin repeat domain-containing protein [Candidatus Babeliales bacterium]